MPLHADKNLYPGVNPHLNSILQAESGGWESFHSDYVSGLRVALDAHLPPGYLARSEKSLQISEISGIGGQTRPTRPDVTVYKVTEGVAGETTQATATPTATFSVAETLEEEEYLTGVTIYEVAESGVLGEPVTRLELLSPANKPSGSHHVNYLKRRGETLKSGLRLVEIDLLHETHPILHNLPSYRNGDAGAYPYTIIVSDPRPSLDDGPTDVYGFGVLDQIPTLTIPLATDDTFVFDFGAVYDDVFAASRFCITVVDYEQAPPNLDRYAEGDREAICAKMDGIQSSVGE